MLFNSFSFLGFFVVVLLLYYVLPMRWQNRLLLVASYVFYGAWDVRFLGLLVISTLVTHYVALWLAKLPEESPRTRWVFWLGMFGNLSILCFFKYFNFFVENASALLSVAGFKVNPYVLKIVLPPGISFYTFQAVSYLIDVRGRTQTPTRSLSDFALYHAYFPQLVAGPIERATHLLPQLTSPRTLTPEKTWSAIQLIIIGYVKKIAIADAVAPLVHEAFDAPGSMSSISLVIAIYLFAIQIYGDFSGYSDIARGVSRLLGIELMVNFRQPYFSRNITEFWERWHISLSSWLRDYIFLPLSRTARTRLRLHVNLVITMLVAGLWHGASWNYLAWGLVLAIALIGHKLIAGKKANARPQRPASVKAWLIQIAGMATTFNVVCLSFVFVCAKDLRGAFDYLSHIAAFQPGQVLYYGLYFVCYGAFVLFLDAPCWWRNSERPLADTANPWITGLYFGILIFVLSFLGEQSAEPFIYFQF
jgi:alginate O-acetyltransferase complex protein AlgI